MSRRLAVAAALASLAFAGAAQAAPAFDDVDVNGDGMLSKLEASVVKDLDFDEADLDKDGMLDRAEYDAATT